MKEVIFEKLSKDARLPERQHDSDSGYDLFSIENRLLLRREVRSVGTGLRMQLPSHYEAQIRPRSGLSLKGLTVMNSPGTVDSGYRGEIRVILGNLIGNEIKIQKGDRIAQMVFARCEHPDIELGSLNETGRGTGGFGSTGRGVNDSEISEEGGE